MEDIWIQRRPRRAPAVAKDKTFARMLVGGCDQTPWTFILLVAALNFLSCDSEITPGYSITAQKEVTAQVGLCVHIPCSFTVAEKDRLSPNTVGLWHKRHSFSGFLLASKTGSGPNEQERALLTGDVSKGDCSVSILDVRSTDESSYQFRIEDGRNKFSFQDVRPFITVTAITDKPVISLTNTALAGKEVTLTCTCLGRCSKSQQNIKWRVGEKEHLQSVYTLRNTVANENGSTTYYSNLTFIPSLENQGLLIFCVMNYVFSKKEISSIFTLEVEYPPIVNIATTGEFEFDSKENTSIVVIEGKSVSLECNIKSKPASNVTWWKGNNIKYISDRLVRDSIVPYKLEDISPTDAAIYICHAQNEHGNASKFFNITVKYSPKKLNISCLSGCSADLNASLPVAVNATEGSSLRFLCSAESFPPATLFWTRNGDDVLQNSTSGLLTVNDMSSADEGIYVCKANNTLGESNSTIRIQMIYPPKPIQNSNCSVKESFVVCTCFMQSFPPATIRWRVDSKDYSANSSDDNVWVTANQTHSISRSSLTFKLTDSRKRAIRCLSSNRIGDHVITYYFDNSSTISSLVWIALGMALLLSLAVAAAVFVKRSRNKKIPEKSENIQSAPVYEEAIYCNASPKDQTVSEKQPADQNTKADDESIYMNLDKETQYVTLDFSKLQPRVSPEEQEVEYSEVKYNQKHN